MRVSFCLFALSLSIFASGVVCADDAEFFETGDALDADEMTLEEVSQQLENPLTSLWSITFQNNYSLNEGDAVSGTQDSNTFLFQPAMPIPIGDDMIFIARPVLPLVYGPELDPNASDGVDRHHTGLGDIQVLSLFGPSRIEGAIWGVGMTTKFPTASDDALGQGKYQAGPAAMYFYLGEKWTTGALVQHWNSFAGDDDRRSTSETHLQYVARYKLPGAMSIGMGPTIQIAPVIKSPFSK